MMGCLDRLSHSGLLLPTVAAHGSGNPEQWFLARTQSMRQNSAQLILRMRFGCALDQMYAHAFFALTSAALEHNITPLGLVEEV
jgi:hypothetical protein